MHRDLYLVMDSQAVSSIVPSRIGTASEVHSTTESSHAAGNDPKVETHLREQDAQIVHYQSIAESPTLAESGEGRSTTSCGKCLSYRQKGTFFEHLVYFFALSLASYLGVIIRIYLAKLAEWNGVPYFHSFYAEIVGTAIMGFIVSHKKWLEVRHKPVYQAIATGLCGSITTFSSWNSEAATVLLQLDQEPVDNATRIIGWFTIILLGFGMSVTALMFGKHIAALSPWNDRKLATQETDRPAKRYVIVEGIIITILWIISTVVGVATPYAVNRYDILFSVVFSTFGTYVRWHLSPLNNVFEQFQLGTFIANILGSWVLGSLDLSQRYLTNEGVSEQDIIRHVLAGLGTGFCGCLTTVSTFAVELTSLSLKATYFYALLSILLAQVGQVLIRGSYEWVVAS